MAYTNDIDIARSANLLPIEKVGSKIGVYADDVNLYGKNKAKITYKFLKNLDTKKSGKLILVTAISPTPAGEGKTTTTVGLGDALNKKNKKTIICLREPSLGPCFGMKGGAAGGGFSQVVPMEDINLHFTGDMHAITSAHNLLAAMIDNHIYWGNKLNIDTRRISYKRVLDMNDRALRKIVSSLGGISNGFSREDGFDITVASEIMAIFCLSNSLDDLIEKIGNIIIGFDRDKNIVLAKQINAHGAMGVLLKDAFMPNLVQTLENNPAFVHGGPFANIAHGCNSIIATKTALKLSDYVITEAGFGADLGAEKFFNIKCRIADLKPDAVVIVATIRALKMHGGILRENLEEENIEALKKGCKNLQRHIENINKFGLNPIIAINQFSKDTKNELEIVKDITKNFKVNAVISSHWENGGSGALSLADTVIKTCENESKNFKFLYKDEVSLVEKIKTICIEIYRAKKINFPKKIIQDLLRWEKQGYKNLPICMAKTQYSFSTDPKKLNAPIDHDIDIREVKLSAGAGFIIVITGEIMTMPGLPKVPSAEKILIDQNGLTQGLF